MCDCKSISVWGGGEGGLVSCEYFSGKQESDLYLDQTNYQQEIQFKKN